MKFSIFVGDLAVGTNEDDLTVIFSQFGVVLEVRIVRDRMTFKSLLYGFIDFQSAKAAADAIQYGNGLMFKGRAMRVKWANSKTGNKDYTPKNTSPCDSINASVYVTFQPLLHERVVTETKLRSIFAPYGEVIDATIHQNIPKKQVYGFVRFSNDEFGVAAAVKAVNEMKNVIIDGIKFNCDLGNDLKRRFAIPKLKTGVDDHQRTLPPSTFSRISPPLPGDFRSTIPEDPDFYAFGKLSLDNSDFKDRNFMSRSINPYEENLQKKEREEQYSVFLNKDGSLFTPRSINLPKEEIFEIPFDDISKNFFPSNRERSNVTNSFNK